MNRLALALLALATAAFAEPATIKVFEAKVYEKPDATSAVLHAFPENEQVSVSEAPENGFRKVRLPDGKVGYVEEASLSLGAAMPSDAPLRAPEATPPAATPPRPTIYVKDLQHLATLVKDDQEVAPLARGLANREMGSNAAVWGGLAAGAAIAAVALFAIPKECSTDVFGTHCTYGTTTWAVMGVGIGVIGAGSLASMAIRPTRSDLLDVINKWNTRHPDDQFTIDRAGSK